MSAGKIISILLLIVGVIFIILGLFIRLGVIDTIKTYVNNKSIDSRSTFFQYFDFNSFILPLVIGIACLGTSLYIKKKS
jgi:hypothetical protein